jgi:hypothetical protein
MILLPPLEIQQGLPFAFSYVWSVNDVPVNMSTGWTGTVTFKRQVGDQNTLLTVTPTLGAAGQIEFALTAAQTRELPALDKRGPFVTCLFQIAVSNATTGEVFQGDTAVTALL